MAYAVALLVCGTVFGVLAVLSYGDPARPRLVGIASATIGVFLVVFSASVYLRDVIA